MLEQPVTRPHGDGKEPTHFTRRLLRWLLRRPEHQPRGLSRAFSTGTVVIVLSLAAAVAVGIQEGLWNVEDRPVVKDWPWCRRQEQHREARVEGLEKARDDSKTRYAALDRALTDPHDPAFANARTALQLEKQYQLGVERDLIGTVVRSVSVELVGLISGLGLVIIFALLAARLALAHGSRAMGGWSGAEQRGEWRSVYWTWVAIVFVPHLAREVYTSILVTQKSWTAWNSLCISPLAWTLTLPMALGVSMVVAYPATILWHFSSRDQVPLTLDIGARDGAWGVGRYVLFLHTWSIVTLVVLLLPCALWLRLLLSERSILSAPYLLPPAILFVAAFTVSGRLMLNAIAVRRKYRAAVAELGATWQEIQEKNPPPDPTISFIGEHWWSLPGVIVGGFIALQLILEQLGVATALFEIAGLQ